MENKSTLPYCVKPGNLIEWFNNGALIWLDFNHQVFELNEISSFILKQVNCNFSIREIVIELVRTYDVSVEQAEVDISSLLCSWLEIGLISALNEHILINIEERNEENL